jgi:hypothetical protein
LSDPTLLAIPWTNDSDIVLLLAQHADRRGNKYWRGADLVVSARSCHEPVVSQLKF